MRSSMQSDTPQAIVYHGAVARANALCWGVINFWDVTESREYDLTRVVKFIDGSETEFSAA